MNTPTKPLFLLASLFLTLVVNAQTVKTHTDAEVINKVVKSDYNLFRLIKCESTEDIDCDMTAKGNGFVCECEGTFVEVTESNDKGKDFDQGPGNALGKALGEYFKDKQQARYKFLEYLGYQSSVYLYIEYLEKEGEDMQKVLFEYQDKQY